MRLCTKIALPEIRRLEHRNAAEVKTRGTLPTRPIIIIIITIITYLFTYLITFVLT